MTIKSKGRKVLHQVGPELQICNKLHFYIKALFSICKHYCLLMQVLKPDSVRDCLSLMYSCGMYNYSGQFAFKVLILLLHCIPAANKTRFITQSGTISYSN